MAPRKWIRHGSLWASTVSVYLSRPCSTLTNALQIDLVLSLMKKALPVVLPMPTFKSIPNMVVVSSSMSRECIIFIAWYVQSLCRMTIFSDLSRISSARVSTSITIITSTWVDMLSRTKAKSSAYTSVSHNTSRCRLSLYTNYHSTLSRHNPPGPHVSRRYWCSRTSLVR